MIYFTSDLHFYHDNIIKAKNRRFRDSEHMNKVLIDNWNKVVKQEDDVYILGDFTLKGPNKAMDILLQLNGNIHLIIGNHDHFYKREQFEDGLLVETMHYKAIEYQSRYFILFHYPIEEWDGMYRGAYHLHGHQHNDKQYNIDNKIKGIRKYDVGVDSNDMKLISIDDIIHFFESE